MPFVDKHPYSSRKNNTTNAQTLALTLQEHILFILFFYLNIFLIFKFCFRPDGEVTLFLGRIALRGAHPGVDRDYS